MKKTQITSKFSLKKKNTSFFNISKINFSKHRKVIKVIDIKEISGAEAFEIANEALLLAKLEHANILRFYDAFNEGNFFYIITEHCEV